MGAGQRRPKFEVGFAGVEKAYAGVYYEKVTCVWIYMVSHIDAND